MNSETIIYTIPTHRLISNRCIPVVEKYKEGKWCAKLSTQSVFFLQGCLIPLHTLILSWHHSDLINMRKIHWHHCDVLCSKTLLYIYMSLYDLEPIYLSDSLSIHIPKRKRFVHQMTLCVLISPGVTGSMVPDHSVYMGLINSGTYLSPSVHLPLSISSKAPSKLIYSRLFLCFPL